MARSPTCQSVPKCDFMPWRVHDRQQAAIGLECQGTSDGSGGKKPARLPVPEGNGPVALTRQPAAIWGHLQERVREVPDDSAGAHVPDASPFSFFLSVNESAVGRSDNQFAAGDELQSAVAPAWRACQRANF